MSETTPAPEPAPAAAAKPATPGNHLPPDLVEPALKAFCVMLWTGLVLAVIGVIALFIGIIDDGYSRSIAPYVIGCGAIGLAAPFLSAAGVIAGLGRREEASSTSR